MSVFGYQDKGPSVVGLTAGIIFGCRPFACPSAGIATSISVYLEQWGATPKVKCAIYKDSDDSLVGVTEEWTLTGGWDGWKTLDFIGLVPLIATDYILAIWVDNNVKTYKLDPASGVHIAGDNDPYDGVFPDPCPWSFGKTWQSNEKISIFCTYETVMDVFGYQEKGPDLAGFGAGIINGCRPHACPSIGTAKSITVYLKQFLDTPRVKCAIYKDSDDSLVGVTEEWRITAAWDGWKTLDFVGVVPLIATNYILAIWGDNTYAIQMLDPASGFHIAGDADVYDGVYPDPCPWSAGKTWQSNKKVSIFCTYDVPTAKEGFSAADRMAMLIKTGAI